jgi:hypothetical protein
MGYQLLIHTDDGNLFVKNINTIKKKTEVLIGISNKVSLGVNAEKAKYVLMSYHQNTGQNYA